MGLHPAAVAGAAAIVLVAVSVAKQPKPVRAGLAAVLSGVGAMGAVNMLAPFTGVGIPMNGLTWFVSTLLGIPGVTMLLLLRLLFGIP